VDVDPKTYNIDPGEIEGAITDRTRAILPLHLFGRPADMDAILDIAQRHGLAVVEDAAQSTGSLWRERPVGGIGTVGMFSFQAEKPLNCGEGGAVATNDEDIWRRALSYSDYWKGQMLPHSGWDALHSGFRMTEFQGAILLGQLQRLDEQSDFRQSNGFYLDAQLQEVGGIGVMPEDVRVTRDCRSLYVFRYRSREWNLVHRNAFVKALQAEGIPAVTGYSCPLYENPVFRDPRGYLPRGYPLVGTFGRALDYTAMSCPVAERACAGEAVWLVQQTLMCSRSDVQDIVEAVVKLKDNLDELERVGTEF
jgi:dTDP-4-amino-4,6-dideoxygalactose transaminase